MCTIATMPSSPGAITVGFVSLMIVGVAGKVVPTLNGVDVTSSVRICWDTERPDRTNTTALSFHRIQIAARTSSLPTACFGTTGS